MAESFWVERSRHPHNGIIRFVGDSGVCPSSIKDDAHVHARINVTEKCCRDLRMQYTPIMSNMVVKHHPCLYVCYSKR